MKNIKQLQILLSVVFACFIFASPAFSALSTQCTSDDLCDLVTVDKNAPGTKLSGPLTLYFVDKGNDQADMYVFLRLRKGYTLYGFSTIVRDVTYDAQELPDIEDKIETFIEDTVIPEIYGGELLPPPAIKSIDQIVQDDPLCNYCPKPPPWGNEEHMNFIIMDIIIAVQD